MVYCLPPVHCSGHCRVTSTRVSGAMWRAGPGRHRCLRMAEKPGAALAQQVMPASSSAASIPAPAAPRRAARQPSRRPARPGECVRAPQGSAAALASANKCGMAGRECCSPGGKKGKAWDQPASPYKLPASQGFAPLNLHPNPLEAPYLLPGGGGGGWALGALSLPQRTRPKCQYTISSARLAGIDVIYLSLSLSLLAGARSNSVPCVAGGAILLSCSSSAWSEVWRSLLSFHPDTFSGQRYYVGAIIYPARLAGTGRKREYYTPFFLILMWTIHMSRSYHLISQAGCNRCNLLYSTPFQPVCRCCQDIPWQILEADRVACNLILSYSRRFDRLICIPWGGDWG